MTKQIKARPLVKAILVTMHMMPEYGNHESKYTVQTFRPTVLSRYIPQQCYPPM